MAHPILDGPITILKVVTPGSYWIKCGNCRGSCRVPESVRRKPYSDDFYPATGAKVLVHDSDGFFYEGTVCCRGKLPLFASMQARKYTVQLTRTLQVKDVDRCHIYPTFDEDSIACESAHLISLYRVLPALPPPEFASPRESKNVDSCESFVGSVRNWDEFNNAVEDLINKWRRFRYEQLAVIKGSLYGKLSYFETSREVNIKDVLASENIVVRSSFRFENVVQSLMSRPLHKCTNPLPLYSPGVVIVPRVIPKTKHKPSKEELSNFRVHEEDVSLHEKLWTHVSTNILFTGLSKPVSTETPIRYVAPSGEVVLGTVLSPKVITYVLCEREVAPDDMLKRYVRDQYFSCNPQRFDSCMYYERNSHVAMPPLSTDDEDSISNHSAVVTLLSYDFDEALKRFCDRGGILGDYCTLTSLLPSSEPLVELVEVAFESLGVSSLEDWQLVCLPSMLSKQNVLVIGPKSHKKLTTSIVSTLSLMKHSLEISKQNSSPNFVLLVNNHKRATQAAKLCEQVSSSKVIVATCSQITESQKREIQAGCDILISTPRNWLKFTDELRCVDCSLLSHVVFDSFEKLHSDYPSEIMAIFKEIQSKDHIKAVFLSNIWGSFLVEFIPLLDSPTRCVTDLVEACFCYLMEPTIVIAADDWDEMLTSIIQNDRTTLRLLLCSDHFEVTAIKSRTNHLENILYVHENEDRQSVLDRINQWKSNSESFLVSSDLLFNELDFANNANLLVSWKLNPCSRSTLTQRFNSIRAHPVRLRRKVPVYIFCSRDNLEELVFLKQVLGNVKHPVCLGGDIDDCINSTFKTAESLKVSDHCSSLCMFGTCEMTPLCPYRHDFRPQDSIHFAQKNVFLKMTLVKCHSAFHSTVRVEDVISNQEPSDTAIQIVSFKSKLPQIEAELEHAFVVHSNETPKCYKDVKVDDVVGAVITGNIYRRVKIISTREIKDEEGIEYEVLFMDYDEPNSTLLAKDLFPIPSNLISYPRDVVDIFISKLVPVDFKSNWEFETTSFLVNYADLISQNDNNYQHKLLAGAVEVVIERNIIVNSIHWCRVEDPSTYVGNGSMKEVILASKYAKENHEHFTVLSKLAVDCGKQPFISLAEEEFGFRKKFPNEFVGAVVSAFDDPGLFYVQLADEQEKLQEFEASLSASLNKCRTRLPVVVLDELCCVQIDGVWNRALILGKDAQRSLDSCSLVTILCVDHGDTRPSVSTQDLFCLPNEFIDGIPYFAIECKLVGILPFEGHWSDAVVGEFERHIRDLNDLVTQMAVKFCGVVNENQCTKHFRHQVALRSLHDDQVTVNQLLVSRRMASWDQATVDLLIPREKHPPRKTRRRYAV